MRLGVDANRRERIGPADGRSAVTIAVRHAADDSGGPKRGTRGSWHNLRRLNPGPHQRQPSTDADPGELAPPLGRGSGDEGGLLREQPAVVTLRAEDLSGLDT